MKYFYLSACLLLATLQTSARTNRVLKNSDDRDESQSRLIRVSQQPARFHSALSPYERQIVASVLVLEAASDGVEGMQAVLNIIYNRADHHVYRLVRAAVRRGSFYSMHSIWGLQKPDYGPILRRAQRDRYYADAVKLVMKLEQGALPDTTHGATHYYLSSNKPPYWIGQMHYRATIGSHHFFARYPLTLVTADMRAPAHR